MESLPANGLRVLLTGATGYIGGRLLDALQKGCQEVRCLARHPEFLEPRAASGTQIVRVIASIKLHLCRLWPASTLPTCARQAGVRRIIYLGGLGAEEQPLSTHLRSRQEVADTLRSSQVPTVEFRASIVISSGSISFEMIRALVQRLPVMICPRWVNVKTQPIAVEDVIAYLVAALELPGDDGSIFEVGGADRVSYGEIMQEYARQCGLRRWMIPVPVLTPRLSSLWLGLVTPVYARIGRNLIDSMRNPTLVRDLSALTAFDIKPKGLKEAVGRAIRNEDREFAASRWSDALSSSGKLRTWGGVQLGTRLVDSRIAQVSVPPAAAFAPVQQIGGANGWYFVDYLWWLRSSLDLLVGGVGLRRGRRNLKTLTVGDALDFWRVETYEPDRRLNLTAEMKVPGRAWLQFEVEPNGRGSIIRQTAIFDPAGLRGLIYWYALYPIHRWIFSRMLQAIATMAERDTGI